MPMWNNVRERRRERIQQLLEQHSAAETNRIERTDEADRGSDESSEPISREGQANLFVVPTMPVSAKKTHSQNPSSNWPDSRADNPDPELWWKEREKRLKTSQPVGWQGVKGLSPTSNSPKKDLPPDLSSGWSRLIQGLTLRAALALILFAGAWGWLKLDLPTSSEARDWLVSSVTRDMDFQAIEVWYGTTFGGSPTFFPFKGEEPATKEVAALLNPTDTALPVKGKLVEDYVHNGTGVRVAASGGSEVYAVYTGRVQQVSTDQDGGMTIIVQHQNHFVTVYGNLAKSGVKANDWVEKGQEIGNLHSSEDGQEEGVLYFAVQQNGKALNPADVVSFD